MNKETRKTTKGWKVVREKLVKPIPANPINSHESLNSNTTAQKPSNTEITLPKANPVKGLIKGKARGWKVLRKHKYTPKTFQLNVLLILAPQCTGQLQRADENERLSLR